MLPSKWMFCCKKNPWWGEWYIRKVLFYCYFLKAHVSIFVRIASNSNSNIYPKHIIHEVLNTIFLHNFWVTGTPYSQIIIIMKFFVVSSVDIKKADCTAFKPEWKKQRCCIMFFLTVKYYNSLTSNRNQFCSCNILKLYKELQRN